MEAGFVQGIMRRITNLMVSGSLYSVSKGYDGETSTMWIPQEPLNPNPKPETLNPRS